MSYYAMPFLIFNLGGEMMYILNQRLEAQKIAPEKSKKVLQDVVKHMFDEGFVGELAKPQKIYSDASIREVFDKLAHSSIMRLSTSSMSKLYDLMIMGIKYSFLSCSHPHEILQFTLNHLDEIENIIGKHDNDQTAQDAKKCIQKATNEIIEISKKMNINDFMKCRFTICNFLKDRNIKVSIFLSSKIQFRNSGYFKIPCHKQYPVGFDKPGTCRYFDAEGGLKDSSLLHNHPMKEYTHNTAIHSDTNQRTSKLGHNFYASDKVKINEDEQQEEEEDDSAFSFSAKKVFDNAKDLNQLASMIAGPRESKDTFKVNLFSKFDVFDATPEGEEEEVDDVDKKFEQLTFDCRKAKKSTTIDFDIGSANQANSDEQDDLLDLMDS
ncbi:hypothetical protein C9374_007959 [Naegleria lovaniensis]|uniref:Protein OSCP1 n=1 Tax=Naegleria lovaniensis TaxID=51637 RepID=A0AA88GKE4_NAELO|nr:uncharacterized protein C9374_007959 [Naegleria lovaniensis]KAG2378811.1 hypothetical protein C9374_007959 [Naegleria lovaniensis]